jgi:membrane protease YdiL (CAAX protease family)
MIAMPRERKSIYIELFVTVGLMVLPSLLRAVFAFLHPEEPLTEQVYASWAFGSTVVYDLLMIALLWHITQLNSETMDIFSQPFAARDILRGLGLWIWVGVSWYGTYRFLWSLGVGVVQAGKEPRSLEIFRAPFSAPYLLVMIVNPFLEEFYVRGFLQTRLRQVAWGFLAIVLFSTLLQTSYHLYQGLLACLSLAPGFLILAIYYQASRRLYPVIVAHLVSDLLAMLVSMKT